MGGRPKLSEDLKKVKPITPDQISRIISKFSEMTREEISDFLKDPSTPMMYVAIGSILVKAAKDSDHGRFEFLLRRSVGPVKEHVNLGADDSLHKVLMDAISKFRDE